MDFRFAIDLSPEEGGQEVELIPNSRNIRVTPTNVFNYVRQYALYRMVISQLAPIQSIRAGIFDVLPCKSFVEDSFEGLTVSVYCALPFFKAITLKCHFPQAEDFRLLLNGVNEINVQLLQSYVTFHDGKCGCFPFSTFIY